MSDSHADKMARKKATHDHAMAGKTIERGLVVVHTGAGKGKTTAAFGMVLRCVGHGLRVGIVQFVKSNADTAEQRALASFGDRVTLRVMGEGFTWETQDRERDAAAAKRAWEAAREMISDADYRMVVLDELNVVLRHGHLSAAEVVAALDGRPAATHVVVTGRGAPSELIERADLVTEMKLLKHPFHDGVKAQPGVEF
jgi:cob(I)alamin adenosyltransferase